MESIKNLSIREKLEQELTKNYNENLKDSVFLSLVKKLKINQTLGKENNSKLEDSVMEIKHCESCKGLFECQNKVCGHFLYPKIVENTIDLNYIPCKYKKQYNKLLEEKNNSSKELHNARFKNIDVSDKKRINLIKWLKDFYDNYDGIKEMKGLYLHGSFGSGKTYLIYTLLNELKINKKIDYQAVYFPEILRDLREDWDTYMEKIAEYRTVPILLIDDIGAESVSEWGRDEVLGTILQARMNNHLTTFFTSNLNINELYTHLSNAKSGVDNIKARRIIERVKQLTIDFELITENKRK